MKRYIYDKSAVDMLDEIQRNKSVKEEDQWELVDSKFVYDTDGFATDYTLWYNNMTGQWVTIFGDEDLYHPWDSDFDMEFDNENDARDWFADYDTDYEEDIDY